MRLRNYSVTWRSWFTSVGLLPLKWSHATQMEAITPMDAQLIHPMATQKGINKVLHPPPPIYKSHTVAFMIFFILRKWSSGTSKLISKTRKWKYFQKTQIFGLRWHLNVTVLITHHSPQQLIIPYEQSSLQCQATVITVQATSLEVTHPVDNRDLTKRLKPLIKGTIAWPMMTERKLLWP